MLELRNIVKDYESKTVTVHALKNITVNFRDCEFVSILGASGCGKTTLLNLIGGLDRYTSGDLIINGISTKDFTDEYWDAYRNSEIGFVFQSYNLIPHLSVLANVELALKLSGFSKSECTQKAKEALKKVHMDEHYHKKPNQLSGGQMQRVSIARALVNDPRIILADEPTGALDSELGEQIMQVLKEVSTDRLVIMVTHNDDLAERYSDRIISIKDGTILSDTDPYEPAQPYVDKPREKNKRFHLPKLGGKNKNAPFKLTKMKWKTALGISGKNLLSKTRRTVLTSVAGSIGIIGMGLVLALSNGINLFMDSMKTTLLASVPIGVYEYSMDYDIMTDIFKTFSTSSGVSGDFPEEETAYLKPAASNQSMIMDIVTSMMDSVGSNAITPEFDEYLDTIDPSNYVAIHKYYGTKMNIIAKKTQDGSDIYQDVSPECKTTTFATVAGTVLSSASLESDYWNQLISYNYMKEYYDVLYGHYPQNKNEIVLVVNENNEVSFDALDALGFDYDSVAVDEPVEKNGESLIPVSFADICGYKVKLIPNDDYYVQANEGVDTSWTQFAGENDQENLGKLYEEKGISLEVVGVLRVKDTAPMAMVQCNFCYTPELGEYVRDEAAKSKIAASQKNLLETNSKKNVFNDTMQKDNDSLSSIMDLVGLFFNGKDLSAFNRAIGADSTPLYVNIFAANYAGKEAITSYLDQWNDGKDVADQVRYFDVSEMFIYNVELITNIATMSLLMVAAISLLVSTIMIAIITANSVVERTREIGILRSIGAKKIDILSVFIAETFIIGLLSGLIGIGLTYALAPALAGIIANITGFSGLVVVSPWATVGLLALSAALAVISGFIPSMIAAQKNVVDALRSD